MKKHASILVISCALLFLCACSAYEISGLDNFDKNDCSFSLCQHLFPSDDFLTAFEYENGDYQYCDSGDWMWGYATAFSYLTYSPKIYEEAKAYCLSNFDFCETHQFDYNQYSFKEHICHPIKDSEGRLSIGCNYAKIFNMFAFNDEKCTLLFLGYYNGDPDDPSKTLALTDFSVFLTNTFSDYFNFDE